MLVDRFGHRIVVCVTILGTSICMLVAAVALHCNPNRQDLSSSEYGRGLGSHFGAGDHLCYVAFFSSGAATIARMVGMRNRNEGKGQVIHFTHHIHGQSFCSNKKVIA